SPRARPRPHRPRRRTTARHPTGAPRRPAPPLPHLRTTRARLFAPLRARVARRRLDPARLRPASARKRRRPPRNRLGRPRRPPQSAPAALGVFFPAWGHLVCACAHRCALAWPGPGWTRLGSGRRMLETAGARLETVWTDRAAARSDADFARLHVPAALTVAVAGAAVWLRHHPDGPALHRRFGPRLATFTTLDPEFSIWID